MQCAGFNKCFATTRDSTIHIANAEILACSIRTAPTCCGRMHEPTACRAWALLGGPLLDNSIGSSKSGACSTCRSLRSCPPPPPQDRKIAGVTYGGTNTRDTCMYVKMLRNFERMCVYVCVCVRARRHLCHRGRWRQPWLGCRLRTCEEVVGTAATEAVMVATAAPILRATRTSAAAPSRWKGERTTLSPHVSLFH